MNFEYYIKEQLRLHPMSQPQDIVKLCYQAAFGAEHLLLNKEKAKQYFDLEYESVPISTTLPLYEMISDTVCRVHLAAWKAKNFSPEKLFALFVSSANLSFGSAATDIFSSYLSAAETVISQKSSAFSKQDWIEFIKQYKATGMPALHHSEAYRKAEQPSYRIVLKHLLLSEQ